MKGKQTLIVLELLAVQPTGSYDLLQKLFEAEYETTYRREVKERGRVLAVKLMRSRYHNFLYKLMRDGLIVQKEEGAGKHFAISKKGQSKLLSLRGRGTLPDKKNYPKEDGAGFTVVTFDIPEADRKKRDWLRSVLKHLGFTMVHKSVWLGKTRIPIHLLRDLQTLNLFEHMEVFQVSKLGNLKKFSASKA